MKPFRAALKIRLLGYAVTDRRFTYQGKHARLNFENHGSAIHLHNEFFYLLGADVTVYAPIFRSHFDFKSRSWYFACKFHTKTHALFSTVKTWHGGTLKNGLPPTEVLKTWLPDASSVHRFTAELFIWDGLLGYKSDSTRDLQGLNRVSLCLCNFPRVELERLAQF